VGKDSQVGFPGLFTVGPGSSHNCMAGRKMEFATSVNIGVRLAQWSMGILSEAEELELFQQLVDSGMAWQLEGRIGPGSSHYDGQSGLAG
jgi:hypothetical protein